MQNPINLKPIQAAFKSAKAAVPAKAHWILPTATLLAGFKVAIAQGPLSLSGGGAMMVGYLGLGIAASLSVAHRHSWARKVCLFTPVAGAIAFGTLYNASEAGYKNIEAVHARIALATNECQNTKGHVVRIESEGACLRPDPTNPKKGTYTYDPRLNPK